MNIVRLMLKENACKAFNDTKELNVICPHIMNTYILKGNENREPATGSLFLI